MAPLIAFVVGTGLAQLVGLVGVDALDGWWPALRVGLALMFVLRRKPLGKVMNPPVKKE